MLTKHWMACVIAAILAVLVFPQLGYADNTPVATQITVLQPAGAIGTENVTNSVCRTPFHISSVESDELLKALEHIKKCVPAEGKLDVYVSGMGGSAIEAQAFYDQIRTMGLNSRVRFKSYGMIASASNIVWMAADERVVTPSSLFLLHKGTMNIAGEDPELGVTLKDLQFGSSTNAVRRAAGDKAAQLWLDSIAGKIVASAFDGREAVKNGWATKLEDYK